MSTDNESSPAASPSKDFSGAPLNSDDSASDDEDGSVLALAPNPIIKYMEQVADEKPLAASDDEASIARSNAEQQQPANTIEPESVDGDDDEDVSTAIKSVAASSLHVGEMEAAAAAELEEPIAASDDEASTASTRFGAVEEDE